jgi:hypothetical protein
MRSYLYASGRRYLLGFGLALLALASAEAGCSSAETAKNPVVEGSTSGKASTTSSSGQASGGSSSSTSGSGSSSGRSSSSGSASGGSSGTSSGGSSGSSSGASGAADAGTGGYPHQYGMLMPGTECEFNRDCSMGYRCEANGSGATCNRGPRGESRVGAKCTDGNDCGSSICVDSICSDICNTTADCNAKMPVCKTISGFSEKLCWPR